MQSVDSYLSEIIAAMTPLPPEDLPLTEAEGAVLAADTTAEWPLPGFDNSAMDGYAVRAADVAGASAELPVTLPVDADVAAGDTAEHAVAPGRCVKIMTGALLPPGADAVVPVEWTDDGREHVVIGRPAGQGNAIRRAGDDAKPGDLLLPAGTRLGPAQIGVLAAAGHGVVRARRRPRVTVISTGNELAEPGSPLVPGRIWDSNSYMLAAAARQAGCETTRHATLRDEPGAVLDAIEHAAAAADLIMTSSSARSGSARSRCSRGCRRGSGLSAPSRALRSSRCRETPCPRSCRSGCSSGRRRVPCKAFRLNKARPARPGSPGRSPPPTARGRSCAGSSTKMPPPSRR